MATFAERFNEALKNKGLNATEFSKISGIGPSQISSYRSGKIVPRTKSLGRIADVLDVTPVWLAGDGIPEGDTTASQAPESKPEKKKAGRKGSSKKSKTAKDTASGKKTSSGKKSGSASPASASSSEPELAELIAIYRSLNNRGKALIDEMALVLSANSSMKK